MTIMHACFTVSTSPTLIATIPEGNPLTSVVISNADNQPIFVGDNTVAKTGAQTGVKIAAGTNTQVWLNAGDELYGISNAGTASYAISVLYSNVIP